METATNCSYVPDGDEKNQECSISFEKHETQLETHEEKLGFKQINWCRPQLLISSNKHLTIKFFFNTAILIYLLAAINHWYTNGSHDIGWKNGLGLLIILTFLYFGTIILKLFIQSFKCMLCTKIEFLSFSVVKNVVLCVFFASFAIFLYVDTANNRHRLMPLIGLGIFFLGGYAMSKNRGYVNWNTVASGLATQIMIGLLTVRWSTGRVVVQTVGQLVEKFFAFSFIGAEVTYGHEMIDVYGVFAFKILSVLFFMCFFIEILYYYGIIQTIVIKLGSSLQCILGTTAAESVNTCASVFLGMTEAPIIIKPYLADLTESEIHSVMMGGFSTVAGTVFAAYTSFGIDSAYIITASVMSAPTALSFSKLIMPETIKSLNKVEQIVTEKSRHETNVIDAACKGAQFGVQLVGAIIANIVAFVSFVAFVNAIISWLGNLVGFEELSFEYLLGKILIPVTWLLGVDFAECETVGRLIGLKMTINEFVAYKQMGELIKDGKLNRKSEIVATFALCSFANPGSVGSMIATLTTLCPSQRTIISKHVLRAFIGGTVTCFLTAAVASLLMPDQGFEH